MEHVVKMIQNSGRSNYKNIMTQAKNLQTAQALLNEKASGAIDDIIVDGSHLNEGKLKPNIKYKSGENEYSYKTDGAGRISDATTNDLKLKSHEGRLPHNPKTPDKQVGDHAGHLFGDRFGGSPELDNLVSQASKVNLSEYKK